MNQNYTGISFPFRIGVKGGVVMSTTDMNSVTHINEAIYQILSTHPMERGMEYAFKSEVETSIFEPNDTSTSTLIGYQIREALNELEPRIEVNKVDLQAVDNTIIATIHFKVKMYDTTHTTSVKVGELDAESTN